MAETIPVLESAQGVYDWKLWTNGKAWRAVLGVDFQCTAKSFAAALYTHAARNGIEVKVARRGDTVDFQFTKRRNGKRP